MSICLQNKDGIYNLITFKYGLDLKSYLEENANDFVNYEYIMLNKITIDGDKIYFPGNGEKTMKATVVFTPLKKVSTFRRVFEIDGKEETVDLKFLFDCKEFLVFGKNYIFKKIEDDTNDKNLCNQ